MRPDDAQVWVAVRSRHKSGEAEADADYLPGVAVEHHERRAVSSSTNGSIGHDQFTKRERAASYFDGHGFPFAGILVFYFFKVRLRFLDF